MQKIIKKSLLALVLVVFSALLVGCIGDNLKTDVVQEGGDSSSEVRATVEESPVSETAPAEENQVVEESAVSSDSEQVSETVEAPAVVEAELSTPVPAENSAVVTTEPVAEPVATPVAEPVAPPALTETTQVSESGSCDPDVAGYMQPLIASNSVSQSENQTYSISGPGCDDGVVTFQKRNGDIMLIVAFGLAGECRSEFHYTYHFATENLVKEKSRSQCVNQDWSAWKTY